MGVFEMLSRHFPIDYEEKHEHWDRTGNFPDLKQWRVGGGEEGRQVKVSLSTPW
jgi:hypothetical protein